FPRTPVRTAHSPRQEAWSFPVAGTVSYAHSPLPTAAWSGNTTRFTILKPSTESLPKAAPWAQPDLSPRGARCLFRPVMLAYATAFRAMCCWRLVRIRRWKIGQIDHLSRYNAHWSLIDFQVSSGFNRRNVHAISAR